MSNSGKRKFKRHTDEENAALNDAIAGDPGMFEATDFSKAKRGRPKLANPKKSTTLRLDAEVLELLKETGPGWQTRVSDLLRVAFGLEIAPDRLADLALRKLVNISKDTSQETEFEIAFEGMQLDAFEPKFSWSDQYWSERLEINDPIFTQGLALTVPLVASPPFRRTELESTEQDQPSLNFEAEKSDSELDEALKQVTDAGYLVRTAPTASLGATRATRYDLVEATATLAKHGYIIIQETELASRLKLARRQVLNVGDTVQKKQPPGSIAARTLHALDRKRGRRNPKDIKPEQD